MMYNNIDGGRKISRVIIGRKSLNGGDILWLELRRKKENQQQN